MQKNVLRFFSSLLAVVILSSVVIPASADFGGGTGRSDFFTWTDGFGGGSFGGGAGREQSKSAYDNYVETLPAQGYASSGKLIWQPTFSDFDISSKFGGIYPGALYGQLSFSDIPYLEDGCKIILNSTQTGFCISSFERKFAIFRFSSCVVSPPIDGAYSVLKDSPYLSGAVDSFSLPNVHDLSKVSVSVTPHADGRFEFSYGDRYVSAWIEPGVTYVYFPIFEITPYDFSGDTYNINTRPTSITGGNYGIVGDNGQITKVEDNSTIINETNSTFYNPATGQTVPIVNWSYDYSDRSYKVTLESGDTATITYGDENITIQETTITEGDTITNNYTIYYLIDGSGSVTPPCEHDWQEASGTDPTCTLPGKVTLSCTKCQQTKTETLPALGHDWQVKQTVTTQYDDTGQLIQEGYTIFECSRCKEQYKSPDGTIPPGGGSGTDPGGEEEDEGFLSWLLGKLGELLGTIGDGILNLLQTALDKIFGGLIDLVNSLFENLVKLVDLFGTVGEAFQVLWTWLPPEITAILVAGVSIFVFVALLKFFMK